MKVSLERINSDYLFEVRNEAGRSVILDNKSKSEGVVAGISPHGTGSYGSCRL